MYIKVIFYNKRSIVSPAWPNYTTLSATEARTRPPPPPMHPRHICFHASSASAGHHHRLHCVACPDAVATKADSVVSQIIFLVLRVQPCKRPSGREASWEVLRYSLQGRSREEPALNKMYFSPWRRRLLVTRAGLVNDITAHAIISFSVASSKSITCQCVVD